MRQNEDIGIGDPGRRRRCAWGALALWLFGICASAAPILVRDKRARDGKRGKDFTRITSQVQFRGASFDYRTLVRDSDPEQCVAEKWGDFMFGLSFGRRGNGGWDIWRFLRPIVTVNDKPRDALLLKPLQGAYVLQEQPKAALEFVWDLSREQDARHFRLRAVREPAVERWLFLRLDLQGEATWKHIAFSCYPGNTSGPPTRRRWVAGRDRDHNLHDGATTLPATKHSSPAQPHSSNRRDCGIPSMVYPSARRTKRSC